MGKKILIVDDDLYIRELYEEICKGAGCEVMTAKDGEEALEKLKSNQFDIILLDIMMPKLDGLNFLVKITEDNPLPKKTPVAILTNLAHESIINQALEKGAATCIIKSEVTPEKLIATINQLTQ